MEPRLRILDNARIKNQLSLARKVDNAMEHLADHEMFLCLLVEKDICDRVYGKLPRDQVSDKMVKEFNI